MNNEIAEKLSQHRNAVIIAPAGCGKTELIARAVELSKNGKQLVLTHTHAGVKCLLDRMKKYNILTSKYSINTIAGFSKAIAYSYPKTSGINPNTKENPNWEDIYPAATKVLLSGFGRKILSASYGGLYVDEYQDCNVSQHQLICAILKEIPTRILGDPLQGIFDFQETELVDWNKHVFPNFERIAELDIPWRWKDKNEALGNWLMKVRRQILNGEPIDLKSLPVGVERFDGQQQQTKYEVCMKAAAEKNVSAVALEKIAAMAHNTAKSLHGIFLSMEEIECRDLLKFAKQMDELSGISRALAVLDFSKKCMTKVSTELSRIRKKIESSDFNFKNIKKHQDIYIALIEVSKSNDNTSLLNLVILLESIGGRVIFRREMWNEMKKSIREKQNNNMYTFQETVRRVRDQGRIMGRKVFSKVISRPPLIKGLEFDHSIILDADKLSDKELYVAMTRGSNKLSIISASTQLNNAVKRIAVVAV